MCANHRSDFDNLSFFIRFIPEVSLILLCSKPSVHQKQIQMFVFVNYSGSNSRILEPFHGKIVGLDILDRHAPFPSIFIIHEMRIRGFHPFAPIAPAVPDGFTWQNWISSDGVLNSDGTPGLSKRNRAPGRTSTTVHPLTLTQPQTAGAGTSGVSSSRSTLPPLDGNLIAEILAATYASPSWNMEGTTWTGTAEENLHKYKEVTGTEDG